MREASGSPRRNGGQHLLRGERADDGLNVTRREPSMDLRAERSCSWWKMATRAASAGNPLSTEVKVR